ncbi:OLC1v1008813C1 [Oldenlandia corymbosa var. corymbosa]|uniref:OLC1v1008813C1 n=1 Tax=Oldenlandia corymbosa var. corymbosa TaxID=529605 RepID=A0AAV1DPZ3_OLDCO|nr:OLC1v1008813C1 [Oldenlandia corymbosa var. corymbosa]
MAEYDPTNTAATIGGSSHHQHLIHKETALQALNTIIQLHFEKTLEKKRAVDVQKKELWKLFQLFFLFLGIVFLAQSNSPTLQCRHCWIPIGFLSLAHLIFYVSVAQTLRCINGFKYQRRCHKLTLGLATERLRQLRIKIGSGGGAAGGGGVIDEYGDEFEIPYQEPPESYFGKFKRNWILHFGFLIFIYGFMVSSSVVMLCF